METLRHSLLIVCDVRMYSDHLKTWLDKRLPGLTIESSGSASHATQRVSSGEPDLVLLDLRCRDSQAVLQALAAARPNCRFIAFAVDENEREILACAEAGASAYVPADASADDLAQVIETVRRGDQHLPPRVAAALLRRLAGQDAGDPRTIGALHLTARERQILALVVQERTNKEIATRLNIEVATVKNHVHNLLLKLRVKSRSEAAARVRDGSRSRIQIPEVHPS